MAWYWWVLIALGVIAIGALKLKVLGIWMRRRAERNAPPDEED